MAGNRKPRKKSNGVRRNDPKELMLRQLAFKHTMTKACMSEGSDIAKNVMVAPLKKHIDSILAGTLNDDEFLEVCEASVALWCVGAHLGDFGVGTEAAMHGYLCREHGQATSTFMTRMSERRVKHGHYVAKAEEITALKETVNLLEKSFGFMTVGETTIIMTNAANIVREAYDKTDNPGGSKMAARMLNSTMSYNPLMGIRGN